MALSRLSVKCVLCRGAISIRAGNLDKMRLHMENDHDAFYNQDLLISLNFLEDFEREEIIEKALPRMKVIFKNVEGFKKGQIEANDSLQSLKRSLYDELKNHTPKVKRLKIVQPPTNNNLSVASEPRKKVLKERFITDPSKVKISPPAPDKSRKSPRKSKPSNSQGKDSLNKKCSVPPPDLHSMDVSTDDEDDKLEIVVEKVEEKDTVHDDKCMVRIHDEELKDEHPADKMETDDGLDSRHLAENIQTLKSQIKALQDASKHGNEGATDKLSNEQIDKEDSSESHLATTSTVTCDICQKKFQKSSLYKHRKRCEKALLGKTSNDKEKAMNSTAISEASSHDTSTLRDFLDSSSDNLVIDESASAPDVDQESKNATCKFCAKSMLKGNLGRHMKKFHSNPIFPVMITPMKEEKKKSDGENRLVNLKCKVCKKLATSVDELKVHSSEVHSLDYDDIEQMLADDGDVENIPSKEIKKELQVEKVSAKYKRQVSDEFMKDSPAKEEKADRFLCFYCNKDFSMEQSRKRHVKQSHKEMFDKYVEKMKTSHSM